MIIPRKQHTLDAEVDATYYGWRGFNVCKVVFVRPSSYVVFYGFTIGPLEVLLNNPFAKDEE